MTDEEIDALLAGRELDALVHQKVFGRKVVFKKGEKIATQHGLTTGVVDIYSQDIYIDPDDTTLYLHATDGFTGMIPHYSTNLNDAIKIVDHYTGNCEDSDCFIECWSDGEWFVASHPMGYSSRKPTAHCDGKITGKPSLPLAICRWGLKKAMDDD